MEKAEYKEIENGNDEHGVKEEVYTKIVRAGKRTYFFDVKATRKDDYYITITESKKRLNKDGSQFFEKHKIFLYKEDFEKFIRGLTEVISFIGSETVDAAITNQPYTETDNSIASVEYTNVEFEDLGENKS